MHRPDGGDRRYAGIGAPAQKFLRSSVISTPRVRIADFGREEFEEAHRGAPASGGDQLETSNYLAV